MSIPVRPVKRSVLFTITSRDTSVNAQIAVLDMASGQHKTIVRGGSHGER